MDEIRKKIANGNREKNEEKMAVPLNPDLLYFA